jgi:hypothetical protein
VSPPSPDLETVVLEGFQNLTQLDINNLPIVPRLVQFDNLCVCPEGTCTCGKPIVAVESGRYCVDGSATESGWSWQLDSEPLVSVTGLSVGSSAAQISAAFASSIETQGPVTASAAVDPTQPQCFQIVFSPGFILQVGPYGGPTTCTVTGAAGGCTFNPTITDASFLPLPPPTPGFGPPAVPPVPSFGLWGLTLLAAALGAVGWRASSAED